MKSGNAISTGCLATLGFWGIDTLVMTQNGRPVAALRSLDDDSHVQTRMSQYEASKSSKGLLIAKAVVFGKITGENLLLKKYGLRQHNLPLIKQRIDEIDTTDLKALRRQLLPIEGQASDFYFKQIFPLFPPAMQKSATRNTFRAYDGLNNTFNLVYALLRWKVHKSLLDAKLEPYLGFMHSEQPSKPSLICDVMELYRHLADDFLIQFSKEVKRADFIQKTEKYYPNKQAKREYLSDKKADELMRRFYAYLDWHINIPRTRHGNRSSIETLISEECSLLARYIRDERKDWLPRIGITL